MTKSVKTVPLLRPSNQHLPQLLCQPLPQGGGVFFLMEELCPDEVLIVYRTLYPVRQLGLYIRLSYSFFLLHNRGVRSSVCFLSPLNDALSHCFVSGIFTTSTAANFICLFKTKEKKRGNCLFWYLVSLSNIVVCAAHDLLFGQRVFYTIMS